VVVHMAKTILIKRGFQVLFAQDGEAGLQIVMFEHPDLILLDLILPGLDGYQVCRLIKQETATKDIPVIMLTSKASPADKVRGLEMGAADYLTKPFDEGELVARVNTHLKLKQLYEALQEKNRQLQELANLDGLTGLYNHRFFQETVSRDFQRAYRYKESLSCILLDIDHFKNFNDTYGHQTGDMVLNTLGGLIRQIMRGSDLAARYGGEEFALLLYHASAPESFVVGERLRKIVEQHQFRQEDLMLKVTISAGLASFPHPEIVDAKTLIECADKALYRSKEEGRNRIVVF
jgi:diguanylate cyclase (GGDEF)-like protein